jgi:hypothetical protein
VAARHAALDLALPALSVRAPSGEMIDLLAISDLWQLVNLDPAETSVLGSMLCDAVAAQRGITDDNERSRIGMEVAEKLREHAIPDKSIFRFMRDTGREDGHLV